MSAFYCKTVYFCPDGQNSVSEISQSVKYRHLYRMSDISISSDISVPSSFFEVSVPSDPILEVYCSSSMSPDILCILLDLFMNCTSSNHWVCPLASIISLCPSAPPLCTVVVKTWSVFVTGIRGRERYHGFQMERQLTHLLRLLPRPYLRGVCHKITYMRYSIFRDK